METLRSWELHSGAIVERPAIRSMSAPAPDCRHGSVQSCVNRQWATRQLGSTGTGSKSSYRRCPGTASSGFTRMDICIQINQNRTYNTHTYTHARTYTYVALVDDHEYVPPNTQNMLAGFRQLFFMRHFKVFTKTASDV
jgi:hypothetical protein